MSTVEQSDSKLISLEILGSIAILNLQRSPMNQINDEFLRQLAAALAAIESDESVAIVRITSNQRAFSAGADLEMVHQRVGTNEGARAMMETARLFHRVYDRLAALPAVTIAEIGGHALGGGLELALACDLRVAAHGARLGLPEAKVGLLPGAGGTQRLTRLCGPGISARLILGGEVVDGKEAERIGLVQWSIDAEELGAKVDAIVERIAGLSPPALRQCKVCIHHASSMNPAGAEAEISGIGELMMTTEAARRVDKFVTKS